MAHGNCHNEAKELENERPIQLDCPIHFYEAQIAAEAITGYDWLARHNFTVVPRITWSSGSKTHVW